MGEKVNMNHVQTHDDNGVTFPQAAATAATATLPRGVTPEKDADRHDDEQQHTRNLEPRILFPATAGTNRALNNDNQQEDTEKELITGDCILKIQPHVDKTYRQVLLNHYEFVGWARTRPKIYGKLKTFVDWLDTDEAKALEAQRQGNETFTYGKHKGRTFAEIALADPTYHVRYLKALRFNNKEPSDILQRYVKWFQIYKGHASDNLVHRPAEATNQDNAPPSKRRKTTSAAGTQRDVHDLSPPPVNIHDLSSLTAQVTRTTTTTTTAAAASTPAARLAIVSQTQASQNDDEEDDENDEHHLHDHLRRLTLQTNEEKFDAWLAFTQENHQSNRHSSCAACCDVCGRRSRAQLPKRRLSI